MLETMPMSSAEQSKSYRETPDAYQYDLPRHVTEELLSVFAQKLHKEMPWMVGEAGFLPEGDGYILEIPKTTTRSQVEQLFAALNGEEGRFVLTDEVFPEDE